MNDNRDDEDVELEGGDEVEADEADDDTADDAEPASPPKVSCRPR